MKKIAFTILFFACVASAFAQSNGFRFGIQASPMYTWMGNNSDNDAVVGDGGNIAFKLGGMGEWYLDSNDKEMFAIRFGLNMTFNQGGSLLFNTAPDSTVLFADSQPDLTSTATPSANFKFQFIELPIALKMRTNEIGSAGIRYTFEVPVITVSIPVASRGTINDSDDFKVGKDTGFLNISWGLGGGLEYPLTTDGVSIVGGIYYQSGIINSYYGKTGLDSIDKSKSTINGITLRLGILF
ncbi:MAG: hypothetical protein ACPG5P_04470 [Saprospiraceae bacterium]